MQRTKLTVRVQPELLENAKLFASLNHTTLTDLIDAYFRHILSQKSMEDAPITRRISGTLSMNVSLEDYKKHLEDKYAR